MKKESFNEGINYSDNKIVTSLLLESSFSKEIRILLKKGQIMKEHKTPFPIIIHILEGEINFGTQGDIHLLKKGAIISLEGNIVHDLTAIEDSAVRLTLSKLDEIERVEKVIKNS